VGRAGKGIFARDAGASRDGAVRQDRPRASRRRARRLLGRRDHVELFRGEAHGVLCLRRRARKGVRTIRFLCAAGADLTFVRGTRMWKHRISHRAAAFASSWRRVSSSPSTGVNVTSPMQKRTESSTEAEGRIPPKGRGPADSLNPLDVLQIEMPVCDFNSHVRAAIDEKRWTQATALRRA